MNKASTPSVRGTLEGGTMNLVVADRWGNMVSVVHSVYSVYGSRITVPGYGFALHNRGEGFTRDQKHANRVAPRKRPFHTIITGFVMKDGKPIMGFGNMQGSIQAYSHTTHLINMIDLGFNPQASADAARFLHAQNNAGPGDVTLEHRLFEAVGAELKALGHPVKSARDTNETVGGLQAILFQEYPGAVPTLFPNKGPVNGVYRSASDPRKDGHAGGW